MSSRFGLQASGCGPVPSSSTPRAPIRTPRDRGAEIELQALGEDLPRIRLDLEMLRERVAACLGQHGPDDILARAEPVVLGREERHVKVNAPFPDLARVSPGRRGGRPPTLLRPERLGQIRKSPEGSVAALDDLVQIGGLGERMKPRGDRHALGRLPGQRHGQGRAELHAADADARRAKPRERGRGILVFDGAVAAVEAELDVILQTGLRLPDVDAEPAREIPRPVPPERSLEERDGLIGGFEDAVGLRLDGHVNDAAGFPANLHQALGHRDEVERELPAIVGRRAAHPGLVGQRHRGDAAFDAVRQQAREDRREVERVGHARLGAPVRRVHVGLDRLAVKGSVRKPVDDGDIEPAGVEKAIETPRAARARAAPAPRARRAGARCRTARRARAALSAPARCGGAWPRWPPSPRRGGCSCSTSGEAADRRGGARASRRVSGWRRPVPALPGPGGTCPTGSGTGPGSRTRPGARAPRAAAAGASP